MKTTLSTDERIQLLAVRMMKRWCSAPHLVCRKRWNRLLNHIEKGLTPHG